MWHLSSSPSEATTGRPIGQFRVPLQQHLRDFPTRCCQSAGFCSRAAATPLLRAECGSCSVFDPGRLNFTSPTGGLCSPSCCGGPSRVANTLAGSSSPCTEQLPSETPCLEGPQQAAAPSPIAAGYLAIELRSGPRLGKETRCPRSARIPGAHLIEQHQAEVVAQVTPGSTPGSIHLPSSCFTPSSFLLFPPVVRLYFKQI